MKYINLTQGKRALVDNEDYKHLNQWKWHYSQYGYASRRYVKSDGKITKILMHRQIFNANVGIELDHINGNRIDNRKHNLRICTRSQNAMNKYGSKNASSGYKGARWHKGAKKWIANIRVNKILIHLGYFINKEDAARAYNKAAIKYFGEFAKLNKACGKIPGDD